MSQPTNTKANPSPTGTTSNQPIGAVKPTTVRPTGSRPQLGIALTNRAPQGTPSPSNDATGALGSQRNQPPAAKGTQTTPTTSTTNVTRSTPTQPSTQTAGAPTQQKTTVPAGPGAVEPAKPAGIAAVQKQDNLQKKWRRLTVKTYEMRSNVLQELLQTERSYIQDLTVLIDAFLKPTREQHLLSGDEINAIFQNIEIIYAVNFQLLTQLEANLKSTTEIGESLIGAVFMKILDFLKMYAFYCSSYKKGIEKSVECESKHPKFAKFLQDVHGRAEMKGLQLKDYLIKPVQRLCKYPLLFRELEKFTPHDHGDYESVKHVIKKVQEAADVANKISAGQENMEKLVAFNSTVKGFEGMDHFKSNRRAIRDEWLLLRGFTGTQLGPNNLPLPNVDCKAVARHVYLFNDIIILTKLVKKQEAGKGQKVVNSKNSEKFKALILLAHVMTVRDIPDNKKQKFVIEIPVTTENGTILVFHFICPAAGSKTQWSRDISTAVKETQQSDTKGAADVIMRLAGGPKKVQKVEERRPLPTVPSTPRGTGTGAPPATPRSATVTSTTPGVQLTPVTPATPRSATVSSSTPGAPLTPTITTPRQGTPIGTSGGNSANPLKIASGSNPPAKLMPTAIVSPGTEASAKSPRLDTPNTGNSDLEAKSPRGKTGWGGNVVKANSNPTKPATGLISGQSRPRLAPLGSARRHDESPHDHEDTKSGASGTASAGSTASATASAGAAVTGSAGVAGTGSATPTSPGTSGSVTVVGNAIRKSSGRRKGSNGSSESSADTSKTGRSSSGSSESISTSSGSTTMTSSTESTMTASTGAENNGIGTEGTVGNNFGSSTWGGSAWESEDDSPMTSTITPTMTSTFSGTDDESTPGDEKKKSKKGDAKKVKKRKESKTVSNSSETSSEPKTKPRATSKGIFNSGSGEKTKPRTVSLKKIFGKKEKNQEEEGTPGKLPAPSLLSTAEETEEAEQKPEAKIEQLEEKSADSRDVKIEVEEGLRPVLPPLRERGISFTPFDPEAASRFGIDLDLDLEITPVSVKPASEPVAASPVVAPSTPSTQPSYRDSIMFSFSPSDLPEYDLYQTTGSSVTSPTTPPIPVTASLEVQPPSPAPSPAPEPNPSLSAPSTSPSSAPSSSPSPNPSPSDVQDPTPPDSTEILLTRRRDATSLPKMVKSISQGSTNNSGNSGNSSTISGNMNVSGGSSGSQQPGTPLSSSRKISAAPTLSSSPSTSTSASPSGSPASRPKLGGMMRAMTVGSLPTNSSGNQKGAPNLAAALALAESYKKPQNPAATQNPEKGEQTQNSSQDRTTAQQVQPGVPQAISQPQSQTTPQSQNQPQIVAQPQNSSENQLPKIQPRRQVRQSVIFQNKEFDLSGLDLEGIEIPGMGSDSGGDFLGEEESFGRFGGMTTIGSSLQNNDDDSSSEDSDDETEDNDEIEEQNNNSPNETEPSLSSDQLNLEQEKNTAIPDSNNEQVPGYYYYDSATGDYYYDSASAAYYGYDQGNNSENFQEKGLLENGEDNFQASPDNHTEGYSEEFSQ